MYKLSMQFMLCTHICIIIPIQYVLNQCTEKLKNNTGNISNKYRRSLEKSTTQHSYQTLTRWTELLQQSEP